MESPAEPEDAPEAVPEDAPEDALEDAPEDAPEDVAARAVVWLQPPPKSKAAAEYDR